MSVWSQLRTGVRGLLQSRKVDREIADEIRSYLEQATAALEETGVPHEQARSAALISFGDRTSERERIRSIGWEHHLRPLGEDLRLATGQLRARPLFFLTSILATTAGIAACVSIFVVMAPLFFSRPLYPNADRMVTVWEKDSNGALMADTYGTFRDIAIHPYDFSAIAAVKYGAAVTEESGSTAVLDGQQVTPDYFQVYDVAPVLGRSFRSSDKDTNAPHVAIISYTLWSRDYQRNVSVLKRSINLDGTRYTIIGVMPSSFVDAIDPTSNFWTPLQYDDALPSDGREWGHHIHIIGRLRSKVQAAEAEHELAANFLDWTKIHTEGYNSSGGAPSGIAIESTQYLMQQKEKPSFIASLAAVTLFLALACTTVISLILVYGLQRRTGQPMRVARGATGHRILRQLLLKCVLITVPSGIIGVYAAKLGAGALNSILANGTAAFRLAPLDLRSVIFAVSVALLLAFLLGTVPFFLVRRSHFWRNKSVARRGVRNPLYHFLVIIEVAVAFALLGTTALLLQSSYLLSTSPAGFQPERVVALQLRMGGPSLDRQPTSDSFLEKALSVARDIPGVETVGFVNQLPLSGEHEDYGIQFDSDSHGVSDSALHYSVTPGYFEAMHIHLIQGRLLDDSDTQSRARGVVLISETLAKKQFGNENPIGQRIRVGLNVGRADIPWATIVGVVNDVRQESLSTPGESAFYLPTNQWMLPERSFWLVVRMRRGAPFVLNEVRSKLLDIDSAVAIAQVTTMDQLVVTSIKDRRLVLYLFESFSAIALLFLSACISALCVGRPKNLNLFAKQSMTPRSTEFQLRQMLQTTLIGIVCGGLLTSGVIRILIKTMLQPSLSSPRIYTGIELLIGMFALLIFAIQQTYSFSTYKNVQGS